MRISDWSSDVCSSDLWHPCTSGNRILWLGRNRTPHRRIARADCGAKLPIIGAVLHCPYTATAWRYKSDPTSVVSRRISLEKMVDALGIEPRTRRSEEHTSELQSLMRISYDAFC